MHLTFLSASRPLTKTVVKRDGQYHVTPYPHVARVTSHSEAVADIHALYANLKAHAAQGHCLLNGSLHRPLVNESRAGLALKGELRRWIVFDFDKVSATSHTEVVACYLPPALRATTYVVQHSASMFRPDCTQFSGHLFFALKDTTSETELKAWYEALNFTTPLMDELSLSRSCVALHWPLDVSAAFDSKLIYIAPPQCFGFPPAIAADRVIQIVEKKHDSFTIPAFTPITREQVTDKINELRAQQGLPPRDLKTTSHNGDTLLVKCEPGVITDVKPMGAHYLKFNLNGGDSMGYWLDLNNPDVIKNFKGEPCLYTQQVDEKFHTALKRNAPRILSRKSKDADDAPETELLAIYATNRNSQVMVGSIEPTTRQLRLDRSTENAAKNWLAEFGVFGQPIRHMDIVFDPTDDAPFVSTDTRINTYRPSPFMARYFAPEARSADLKRIPQTIDRVMRSMLGNPTDAVYSHFINWLSVVYQKRIKTGAAWVLSGRTGTGKGTFIKHILTPVFGQDNVHVEQMVALNAQFNGYLENKLFVIFEESEARAVNNTDEMMMKLRHWITDSPVSIRRMGVDHYNAPNYANFLFTANSRQMVQISNDDRRFNFGERQENLLVLPPNAWRVLESREELLAFAEVLGAWPVDIAAAGKPIETQSRIDVYEATTTPTQLIGDAILRDDLEFFIRHTPSDAEALAESGTHISLLGFYKQQIDAYRTAAQRGETLVLSENELYVLFRTLIPDPKFFPSTHVLRRRVYKQVGLDVSKQQRVPGDRDKRARGVLVKWRPYEGMAAPTAPAATEKVVSLKKPIRRRKP